MLPFHKRASYLPALNVGGPLARSTQHRGSSSIRMEGALRLQTCTVKWEQRRCQSCQCEAHLDSRSHPSRKIFASEWSQFRNRLKPRGNSRRPESYANLLEPRNACGLADDISREVCFSVWYPFPLLAKCITNASQNKIADFND